MSSDQRWPLLVEARQLMTDRFAGLGVRRVEYVAALPMDEVWVWLGASTDFERDALLAQPEPQLDVIRQILASLGYPHDKLVHVHSTAQSQETVDRDYESSWFYALR